MGAGVFATAGSVFSLAACGAPVVPLGSGTAAGAGGDVFGAGDVMAGCGALDAAIAGGGDGAICLRPAQAFRPTITAATTQSRAANIRLG